MAPAGGIRAPPGTCSSALYLEDYLMCTSYFTIMNRYDPAFDLKSNVGHCDLYFMVQ